MGKILIVDDAKTMRTIIKNVLKKLGFSEAVYFEKRKKHKVLLLALDFVYSVKQDHFSFVLN